MNDLGTLIFILVVTPTGFILGWNLGSMLNDAKRRGLELAAQEEAANEYERGLRDGWDQGLEQGVTAARRVLHNHKQLSELAKRRFAVGGMRANE